MWYSAEQDRHLLAPSTHTANSGTTFHSDADNGALSSAYANAACLHTEHNPNTRATTRRSASASTFCSSMCCLWSSTLRFLRSFALSRFLAWLAVAGFLFCALVFFEGMVGWLVCNY